jgi:hypothetical protein
MLWSVFVSRVLVQTFETSCCLQRAIIAVWHINGHLQLHAWNPAAACLQLTPLGEWIYHMLAVLAALSCMQVCQRGGDHRWRLCLRHYDVWQGGAQLPTGAGSSTGAK